MARRLSLPEPESMPQVASHLLEECRMVLPGIQARFGFQLIAIFNAKFWDLSETQRGMHLVAIALVALAIVLVMTPAAYHRQAFQFSVSRRFITISSHLLLMSMVPLMAGICIDFYLVADVILMNSFWSSMLACGLALVFIGFWFIFPRLDSRFTAHPTVGDH